MFLAVRASRKRCCRSWGCTIHASFCLGRQGACELAHRSGRMPRRSGVVLQKCDCCAGTTGFVGMIRLPLRQNGAIFCMFKVSQICNVAARGASRRCVFCCRSATASLSATSPPAPETGVYGNAPPLSGHAATRFFWHTVCRKLRAGMRQGGALPYANSNIRR